jgi:hypothetical protein
MGTRPRTSRRSRFTLDGERVGELLRLINRLHEPAGKPAERKRRLIVGLCELLGADAGSSVVTLLDPHTAQLAFVSVVRATPAAGTAKKAKARPTKRAAAGTAGLPPLAAAHGGHSITSTQGLRRDPTRVALLTLARGSRGPAFTPQDVAVLELVHEESTWLYDADLPPAPTAGG